MARKILIALLRNDLRVHDQVLFHAAHSHEHADVTHVLPVYVFDERHIELSGLPGYKRKGPEARTRNFGFWRTGVFRARFQAESVYDLQRTLRQKHSNLLIRFGETEEVATKIAKALQAQGDQVKAVFMQKNWCSEEVLIETRLERGLKSIGVPLKLYDMNPLILEEDLPFPVSQTPDVFTPFRKRVEGLRKMSRDPLPIPSQFKPSPPFISEPAPGHGADLDQLGVEEIIPYLVIPLKDSFEAKYSKSSFPRSEKSAFPFAGGETAALARLDWYFHQGNPPPVARYKETRNGLLGHEYSTKFSPFMCLGTLSPRTIMQSLDEHERKWGETQNTYWVRFEILWRDYFLYIARKFGTKLFTLGGFEEVTDPKQARIKVQPGWWKGWDPEGPEDQLGSRWMKGTTGVPFIDANMAELRESGFMSNRGRQNVASFLTKDLGIDWRLGAEFFESHLVDFEPTSNYGNWLYVAGAGNDPRASRQFNPIKQGNDYDPDGTYIKTWLPQLSKVPTHRIQAPWLLSPADREKYIEKGENGEEYPPKPIIEQASWRIHYDRRGAGNKTRGNHNEKVKNPGPGGGRGRGGGGPTGSGRGVSSRGSRH